MHHRSSNLLARFGASTNQVKAGAKRRSGQQAQRAHFGGIYVPNVFVVSIVLIVWIAVALRQS
jgi:hypothetical protein